MVFLRTRFTDLYFLLSISVPYIALFPLMISSNVSMPMTYNSISRFPSPSILTIFLAPSPVSLPIAHGWLLQNGLALNPAKTEVILPSTRQQLASFNNVSSNHRRGLFCHTTHTLKLLASSTILTCLSWVTFACSFGLYTAASGPFRPIL